MQTQDYKQLTCCLEGFHASLSPPLANSAEKTTTVTSGLKCCASSTNSGPLGLLARMLLASSVWHSTIYSLIWKEKATKQGRSYFQLAASAHRTGGTASPSWATPTAMDHLPPRSTDALMRQACTTRKGRSRPANLREQVDPVSMATWPTPTSRDYKGGRNPETLIMKGRVPSNTLCDAVIWATPQSRDYRTGQRERYEDPARSKNLNDQVGGLLNPNWVSRLMGFPDGWLNL